MLYLASTSPRRQELLRDAGIEFVLHPPGPEPEGAGSPRDKAVFRARGKASTATTPENPGAILGVDTLVELDGEEMGKPTSRMAAADMLRRLMGRQHLVFTAHCLVDSHSGGSVEECAQAQVRCRPLEDVELQSYLDSHEWRDKAGGYGIQGVASGFMTLEGGELDTVIGLNLATLGRLLGRLS